MRKSSLPIYFISISLITVACASSGVEPDTIRYRSTFEGNTRGVVLHQSGDVGHAGMFGSNCPFDTATGGVTGDYDLPGTNEDIQDAEATELGEITLAAVIPGTVHVLDKTDGTYTHVPLVMDGVVEGRLITDGAVGITGDCVMEWMGLDSTSRARTQLSHCSGEFEVNPLTGLAIVSDPEITVVTDGMTTTEAAVAGNLVAYDDVVDVFYVAQVGESRVSALNPDGTERWTVDTPAPVAALDDGGATGTVGTVLALQDGRGAVAMFDGATGELSKYAETPSPAEDLAISGNGKGRRPGSPGANLLLRTTLGPPHPPSMPLSAAYLE